jgi:ribosomal protein L22
MLADETPGTPGAGGAEESASSPAEKTPRRRSRAAAADAAAASAAAAPDAAAEKPKRLRRPANKTDEKPLAEEAPKPRRSRVRAKAAAEETVAEQAAKPRRPGARAAKTREGALAALPSAPAPKPARAAAKKPAAGASRKLVPGRGRRAKDAPVLAPQLVHAHARYVRSSARKARLVCDHIRGKSVPDARAILAFAPRGVAKDWSKLLDSAVANAEHNHELIGDELHVKAVTADVGPTLKRFRPRAMGRATPINKRTSHLSITLGPKE